MLTINLHIFSIYSVKYFYIIYNELLPIIDFNKITLSSNNIFLTVAFIKKFDCSGVQLLKPSS